MDTNKKNMKGKYKNREDKQTEKKEDDGLPTFFIN